LAVVRDRYPDFGPTLAREKLAQCHGLSLAKEAVRRLMAEAGYWVPRRQRPPEIHPPRNRRACLGERVQIDGSEHGWFEGRGPQCTLLVFVDDATSRLMALKFVESESAFAYFAATREYLERHGKPVAFYSDKASVFRVNNPQATGGDGVTQFGRALYEPDIDSICANSSQAKGRVERADKTLQDRLARSCACKASTRWRRATPSCRPSWPTTTPASPSRRRAGMTGTARCGPTKTWT